jgi:hypothetical protein
MFKPLTPERRVQRLVDASLVDPSFRLDDNPSFLFGFFSKMLENDYSNFCGLEEMYTKRGIQTYSRWIAEALRRTCTAGRKLCTQSWVDCFVTPVELRFAQGLCKPRSLTQVEQRMLFYAGLMSKGVCKLGKDDMKEWRASLPLAIEGQHLCLDRGDLPVKMTLQNVRGLKRIAESEAGREKRMKRF